ncbi:TetR/AcrR family transcriptional regulator C-terminal domain-containing protein [Streptomyces qinzhouensis]|uniref:TetR family transcriptional regulator n=1 Tax=Streptomyces qinzhouensis TaxID=2599401 RepID=A0A5B8J8W4_9ACTN|nr:TetR/AcrR family transcriptional regulator C-terminal domain-containing protein [Streptomyces qinzhouensis]QDY77716.1 TetR family transcriptional regulator [Streptomyces qinzhouensis]
MAVEEHADTPAGAAKTAGAGQAKGETAGEGFPSVWTRPRRRKREQPALSRDQIVAEALLLLDSDGVDALSMRKLGASLKAGATSMYSHVANKEELIELVVDEVFGEIDVPEPAGPDDWRPALEHFAHSFRAAILRHPWMASVLGEVGMSYLGPNMMRLSDRLLGIFEAAGCDDVEAADILGSTLIAFVLGTALTEAAYLTALARSGRTEEEWMAGVRPAAMAAAEPFPRLRRRYAALADAEQVSSTRGSAFDQGLACVIDGIAARLAA